VESLRAELERQRQESGLDREDLEARLEAMRDNYLKASKAETRWRFRADEALNRAAAAEVRYTDLLLKILGGGGFTRQGGVGAAPLSVHQDLAVLGLRWPCTLEEVKTAYRALAKQHHPDRSGDPEVFKKVLAAYERVLKALQAATTV
jgi:DnaJ-domain-containing protein 1